MGTDTGTADKNLDQSTGTESGVRLPGHEYGDRYKYTHFHGYGYEYTYKGTNCVLWATPSM